MSEDLGFEELLGFGLVRNFNGDLRFDDGNESRLQYLFCQLELLIDNGLDACRVRLMNYRAFLGSVDALLLRAGKCCRSKG